MKRKKLYHNSPRLKGATDVFVIDLQPRKLSTRLKAWREAAGLKQEEAAPLLGITLRTLENWEQGFSEPRGLAKTAIEAELSKRLNPKKPK